MGAADVIAAPLRRDSGAYSLPAMERLFKFHGLGNDFVLLDRRVSGKDITLAQTQWLCDRHRGIGADGVLVLLPAKSSAARMVVHNVDGSVPEMCGNGLRCAVKYLADRTAPQPRTLSVETGAGTLCCALDYAQGEVSSITVAMGPARLSAPNLPSGLGGGPFLDVPLTDFGSFPATAVSMGNPHLVLWGAPVARAAEWGPKLELAPGFPERTNVEFVEPVDGGLRVVVWERGVGLTQACGTGACAAVAVGVSSGRLTAGVELPVFLPGGALHVRVRADLGEVHLRGPATFVFEAVVPQGSGL